ncbi:DNA replication/repair protein RecF [Synechococcus elongatus]|uniref:DNA replication and repair protein RecF n=1 Tax=Synechococcus elongatus PCC 11802 TaxID=2283154 RepID=A0AAT9JY56_SYNEL|nr:DNA replication/repair protein RecF [Synechococcus elongatus]QFZ91773.1 DNA replication/repair protein RecF [Synechococcus elongatus PCC 11802]
MFLHSLHLQHFRNYRDQTVQFQAPKTILLGENAQGKTNLLEAVELFSTLRSHRVSRDRDLVQSGADSALLTAVVERDSGEQQLQLQLQHQGRRRVQRDGEVLRRQLDLLGSLCSVQFSSLDLDLVRGGPQQRRDWLDRLLIQLQPVYAHLQQQYGRVLRQRNALLRRSESLDLALLNPLNWQLTQLGVHIMRRRSRAIQRLAPLATHWHREISGQREQLVVTYQPNVPVPDDPEAATLWQEQMLAQIEARRPTEAAQRTSLVGPHRDDLSLSIDGTEARLQASQGQQRTLVLSLKLAELELIEAVLGEPPLLLLDDVLAELDLRRQQQLLEAIANRFQTLITTTHLSAFDPTWVQTAQILTVQSGHLQSEAALPVPSSVSLHRSPDS